MARQIGYGALTVTDVTDGINNATIYLYHRYPDASDNDITQGTTGHELPLNNALEYNFTTGRLSSIHGDNDDFRGWTQTIPSGTDAIYVTTAVATSVENTYIIPSWSTAVKLATNGANGVDGADGLSVKAVRELYYFKRTTDSNPQDLSQITPTPTIYTDTEPGHWTSKTPSYLAGGTYYTCIETTLSDNTKAYSSPAVNEALTDANNNAAIARSIAQANEENAQGALAISQGLESRLRYIWVNLNEPSLPSDDTNTNVYLGGTYAASGIDGITFVSSNPSTYGFNSLLRHTKLMFRYNGIALTTIGLDGLKLFAPLITNNVITGHQLSIELTGGNTGALNFYNPKTGKIGLSLNKDNITFYKHDSTTTAATLNGTGLSIVAGGIKGGTANQSGFIYLSTENYGNYSINNSSGITDWKEIIGTKFGVRADGTLYANSAVISGTLTAGANSKIGPWTIADAAIWKGSQTYGTSGSGNMYFGNNGLSISNTFKVSNTGALTATNANISGSVTASTGQIGGWSISSGALSRLADKNGNAVSADKAKFYVYIQSSSGTDGGYYAFALRSRTDAQVTANSPVIGSADVQFGIAWNGYVYARNANITGTITTSNITATGGKIGRYQITSTYLMAGSGSTATGMGGNQAFFAGNSTSDSAPFRVSYGGDLVATKANITGSIVATSFSAKDSTGIRAKVDNNGLTIYDGSGTGSANIQARFSSTIQIGKTNSGYITLSSNGANIFSDSGKDKIELGSGAIKFTKNSIYIGSLRYTYYEQDSNVYGLSLFLDRATTTARPGYVGLSAKNSSGTNVMRLVYVQDNATISGYTSGAINVGCILDMNTYDIKDAGKIYASQFFPGRNSSYYIGYNTNGDITTNTRLMVNTTSHFVTTLYVNGTAYINGYADFNGDATAFGLLKSTKNSNTVTIGSQNSSWCHIYNSADIPFIFNKTVATTSGDLGTTSYKWKNLYMSGAANVGSVVSSGQVTGNTFRRTATTTSTSATANVRITSDGFILPVSGWTSSSIRYKKNIGKIQEVDLDPKHLYDIDVVQFKYKTDHLSNPEDIRYDRFLPGFIAEQVYEVYPVAVDIEDDQVETWSERYIIPPMLKLIQEQHEEIEQLKKEITELKNK